MPVRFIRISISPVRQIPRIDVRAEDAPCRSGRPERREVRRAFAIDAPSAGSREYVATPRIGGGFACLDPTVAQRLATTSLLRAVLQSLRADRYFPERATVV
jgi:hypothetical protein